MAGRFFGALGNDFAVASAREMRDLLFEVEASVPPRAEGRTNDDRERYCIVHYLRALERAGLIQYPFKLTKGESPDFRVEMGSQLFGLEVTEAASEEHQRAMSVLARSPKGSLLEIDEVRLPKEPLRRPPEAGDQAERLWIEQMLAALQKKTLLLGRPHYQLPEVQLLIYDNTGLGSWTVTDWPARLAEAIREWKDAEPNPGRRFSRCSILRDRILIYDVEAGAELLPVPPSSSLPPLLPLTRLGVSEEGLYAFCHRQHIRKLGFFGSVRGERFGPQSDVDVLVEFEPRYRIGLIRLAEVELELSRLLGRKADLRTVPDLSRYFRDEVVREQTDLAYAAS